MKLKNNKWLSLIVITYFTLSLIEVHFALFGVICFSLPWVLLVKTKKKTWCQGYCPRSQTLSLFGKLRMKTSKHAPKWLTSQTAREFMLGYFFIALFAVVMSSIRVAMGMMDPLTQVKLFLSIPVPFIGNEVFVVQPWVTHLSYRFLSMMLSTTLLGLGLALWYKPRTWCAICPISTLSNSAIKQMNSNK